MTVVPLNQKDGTYATLFGELAVATRQYYKGTTLADSQALANAESQLATQQSVDLWTALAREKGAGSNEVLLAAHRRINSGASQQTYIYLSSDNQATVDAAAADYNAAQDRIANLLGMADAPTITITAPAAAGP